MIPVFACGAVTVAIRLLAGRSVLVSYAYLETNFAPRDKVSALFDVAGEKWLDCGAFTIWQKSKSGEKTKPIDLNIWSDFAANDPLAARADRIVALDDIEHPEQSIDNWRRMLADLPECVRAKLVPVWHEGDPIEHLQEYDPCSRLVAIGRTKGRQPGPAGKKLTLSFYDQAFNMFPEGQFHFLGNSNPDTIERYPARSFDATTWERDSAYAESHGFPWSRVTKDTRMRAYIEAIETIRYRPTPPPIQVGMPWAEQDSR